MALNREALWAALWTRLTAVPGLVTKDRRFRDIEKVPGHDQPALFLVTGPQTAEQSRQTTAKWRLHARAFLYARTDVESGSAPSTSLNALLDAVEAALEDGAPGARSPTTLGGLCSHCWITGVDVAEGIGSGQGIAIFDIELLATAGGPP